MTYWAYSDLGAMVMGRDRGWGRGKGWGRGSDKGKGWRSTVLAAAVAVEDA